MTVSFPIRITCSFISHANTFSSGRIYSVILVWLKRNCETFKTHLFVNVYKIWGCAKPLRHFITLSLIKRKTDSRKLHTTNIYKTIFGSWFLRIERKALAFFVIAIKISSHKDLEYNTNAIRFHLWNKYLNGCLIYNRKLSSWNKSMCMESVHNDLKNTCSFFCGVYIIRLNIQIRRNQFCYQYYHSEKNKKFHSNNTCIMWWAIK